MCNLWNAQWQTEFKHSRKPNEYLPKIFCLQTAEVDALHDVQCSIAAHTTWTEYHVRAMREHICKAQTCAQEAEQSIHNLSAFREVGAAPCEPSKNPFNTRGPSLGTTEQITSSLDSQTGKNPYLARLPF